MSPLGKYGQIVAAVIAIGIIGSYLFVLAIVPIFGTAVPESNVNALDKLAFLAAGAVFGAAAAVNGVKAPIDQAHMRIDKIEQATGIPTHGSYPMTPVAVSTTTHTETTPTDIGTPTP